MMIGWTAIITIASLQAMTMPIVQAMVTAETVCTTRAILSPTRDLTCAHETKTDIDSAHKVPEAKTV